MVCNYTNRKKAYMVALDAVTGKIAWTTPPIEGERVGCKCIIDQPQWKKTDVTCTAFNLAGVDLESGKLAWITD
ncbi:hypothetical protein MASR1M31_15170 [Porphyromonadaceae bacterium]